MSLFIALKSDLRRIFFTFPLQYYSLFLLSKIFFSPISVFFFLGGGHQNVFFYGWRVITNICFFLQKNLSCFLIKNFVVVILYLPLVLFFRKKDPFFLKTVTFSFSNKKPVFFTKKSLCFFFKRSVFFFFVCLFKKKERWLFRKKSLLFFF